MQMFRVVSGAIAIFTMVVATVENASSEDALIVAVGGQQCSDLLRTIDAAKGIDPDGKITSSIELYILGFWSGLNLARQLEGLDVADLAEIKSQPLESILARCREAPKTPVFSQIWNSYTSLLTAQNGMK